MKIFKFFTNKQSSKLASSLLTFIVSVCMVGVAIFAYAWFAQNEKTDVDGFSTAFDRTSMLSAQFSAYQIVDIDLYDSGVSSGIRTDDATYDEYGIQTIYSEDDILVVEVNSYDTTFIDYNEFAYVVVRVHLTGVAFDNGVIELQVSRNESMQLQDNRIIEAYSSHLLSFDIFIDNTLNSSSTTKEIYSKIVEKYKNSTNKKRFLVDAATGGHVQDGADMSLVSNIVLQTHFDQSNLEVGMAELYETDVYICLGYDEYATAIFASQNGLGIDDTSYDISHKIPVENDLTAIKVSAYQID